MSKRWDGDHLGYSWTSRVIAPDDRDKELLAAFREGVVETMNSPVVVGLYKVLDCVPLDGLTLHLAKRAKDALVAYEKGLKEEA